MADPIIEAARLIAAQLDDLRHEIAKCRRAQETMAEYVPSVLEALRDLSELVPIIEQLAAKE